MGNLFTVVGKALVFTTLVLGIGVATLSISVYSQRPPWNDPAPAHVDKGQKPLTFAMMSAEASSLGKSSAAASTAWGAEFRALKAAEDTRDKRRAKINDLLEIARKGGPGNPPGPGFFQMKVDPATGLLDLDDRTTPVKGPDGQPLKGAENLLATYNARADEIDQLMRESTKLRREELKKLGDEVVLTENRLTKQRDIRQQLENEAAYLASLEINVAEQQSTATHRRDQLLRRLDRLNGTQKDQKPNK